MQISTAYVRVKPRCFLVHCRGRQRLSSATASPLRSCSMKWCRPCSLPAALDALQEAVLPTRQPRHVLAALGLRTSRSVSVLLRLALSRVRGTLPLSAPALDGMLVQCERERKRTSCSSRCSPVAQEGPSLLYKLQAALLDLALLSKTGAVRCAQSTSSIDEAPAVSRGGGTSPDSSAAAGSDTSSASIDRPSAIIEWMRCAL